MNVIDLFSGGGGLTEGFLREGFNIIAHVEKDKWACETLKTRLCYHYLFQRNDIQLYKTYLENSINYERVEDNRSIIFEKYPKLKDRIDYEVLNYTFGDPSEDEKATSLEEIINKIEDSMAWHNVKKVDLIIGGPPCQAYSLVGRGVMKEKVEKDKRNYLFRYYKEIVDYFQPKAFVFENVPGILTAKNGMIYEAIVDEFNEIGYELLSGTNENPKQNIVNVAELGLPQNRKRVILFGFRRDLNLDYPDIFKFKYDFKEIDTRSAISDLPKIQHGQGKYGEILPYPNLLPEKLSQFQKRMRNEMVGVLQHQSRKHNERDLENYKDAIRMAMKGRKLKYTDLPKERRTHKNEGAFLDRYNVHWWTDIPHTILAHLAKDGHYNIHPDIAQCRSLTVREAARIQTFPDDYYFEGPRTAQYTQVGNAVPPLLSQSIAKSVKEIFSKLL